jgi:predicted signal transduction protein with EAL and GGDEF domain
VAATPFDLGDRQLAVTVSGGCATGLGDDPDDVVLRADAALYQAKASGRNQLVAAAAAATAVVESHPSRAALNHSKGRFVTLGVRSDSSVRAIANRSDGAPQVLAPTDRTS